METIHPIFLIANVTLFVGSLLFWITQRFYKGVIVFALIQLATAGLLLEYFQMDMQKLLMVMGGFYALSVLFVMIHTRIRLNSIPKHEKHLQDRQQLHLKEG